MAEADSGSYFDITRIRQASETMTNERLKYLLDQQQTGRISARQNAELHDWYEKADMRDNLTDRLSENAVSALEIKMLDIINQQVSRFEASSEIIAGSGSIKIRRFTIFSRLAAVFLVLILAAGGLYQFYPFSKQVRQFTKYGEIRTLRLPDGSQVILNGNSQIAYDNNWKDAPIRLVYLTGEAYFKVVHTKDHRKFRVKTAENFSVDVLGTQFSVLNRKSGTRVVLSEGKVRCNLDEKQKQVLVLNPGDLVEFTKKPSEYILKSVEPALYSSWKDRRLILKNTSLRQISDMLTETYGLRIVTDEPELLEREVSGSVPMNNVQTLLEGISQACNLNVIQEGKNVFLSSR